MKLWAHFTYWTIIVLAISVGYWDHYHQERVYVEHLKTIPTPIMDCSREETAAMSVDAITQTSSNSTGVNIAGVTGAVAVTGGVCSDYPQKSTVRK